MEAGVGTTGTAAASIALTKADPDTGDAAVYDDTAMLGHGWATADAGATYTQTGTYGTATRCTTGANMASAPPKAPNKYGPDLPKRSRHSVQIS